MSFSSLKLAPSLLEKLVSLNFEQPTPIQSQAIPAILSGTDVLGIAPTQANFRAMTKEQASLFVKYFFDIATGGNKVRAEQIAFILTNWHWGSGKGGLISFQKMLNQKFGAGLKEDGVIGPKTVAVINSLVSSRLYKEAIKWRADFFRAIAKNDPSQNRFLKGWLNRLNDFVKLHPAPIAISTTLILGLGLLFFLTNRS
jgi:lysozyme family protein